MKDYYAILGISKDANSEDVKKAFRKLAQQYHPDKKGGDEARFKEVSEAYSILSDSKKRAEYDAYGRTYGATGGQGGFSGGPFEGFDFSGFQDAFRQGGFANFDFGDVFGDLFGGEMRRERRGRDISIDIEIPFKDAIFGTERRILISKVGLCEACEGSGATKGSEVEKCTTCNGQGHVREARRSFLGSVTVTRECDSCRGRGARPKNPCKQCAGRGIRKKEEEIAIRVPAGIENGEMIRMPGRGEAVAGGASGDLYIKVHVKKDTRFTREGTTITTSLTVKLTDVLLGSEHAIPTLDGEVTIQVPAGTRHGELLRVRGKGAPMSANGNARGDMLVRINIDFPRTLSKKAKKLTEELREEGV